MILIAHRGNINGPNPERENSKYYIMEAVAMGYDVEIDVWLREGKIYLGHDEPLYQIELDWLEQYAKKLWIHCKNVDIFLYLKDINSLNVFWHENDTLTLTTQQKVWAYPGKQPIKGSIAVMPEWFNDNIDGCEGVCSDYIIKYKTHEDLL